MVELVRGPTCLHLHSLPTYRKGINPLFFSIKSQGLHGVAVLWHSELVVINIPPALSCQTAWPRLSLFDVLNSSLAGCFSLHAVIVILISLNSVGVYNHQVAAPRSSTTVSIMDSSSGYQNKPFLFHKAFSANLEPLRTHSFELFWSGLSY